MMMGDMALQMDVFQIDIVGAQNRHKGMKLWFLQTTQRQMCQTTTSTRRHGYTVRVPLTNPLTNLAQVQGQPLEAQ